MTRTVALLRTLGTSRSTGLSRVLELLGTAVVLPFVVAVDLSRMLRLQEARRALDRTEALTCPCGSRPIPLAGAFTCSACHFVYRGRATACPACGAEPNMWRCPCGVSVPSPTNPVSRFGRRWQ